MTTSLTITLLLLGAFFIVKEWRREEREWEWEVKWLRRAVSMLVVGLLALSVWAIGLNFRLSAMESKIGLSEQQQ